MDIFEILNLEKTKKCECLFSQEHLEFKSIVKEKKQK